MRGVIAYGHIGKDAPLVWFLWNPLEWRYWRWPSVHRMGQFGRYTYRFHFGPIDGKWLNHTPERTTLR